MAKPAWEIPRLVMDQQGRTRTVHTFIRTVGELRQALEVMGFDDSTVLHLTVSGHSYRGESYYGPVRVSDPSPTLDGRVCKLSA